MALPVYESLVLWTSATGPRHSVISSSDLCPRLRTFVRVSTRRSGDQRHIFETPGLTFPCTGGFIFASLHFPEYKNNGHINNPEFTSRVAPIPTMRSGLSTYVLLSFVNYACGFTLGRRDVSCQVQGSNCADYMSDIKGIYCCTNTKGQPTETYIVCDLNSMTIVLGDCPPGNVCQNAASGQASCY